VVDGRGADSGAFHGVGQPTGAPDVLAGAIVQQEGQPGVDVIEGACGGGPEGSADPLAIAVVVIAGGRAGDGGAGQPVRLVVGKAGAARWVRLPASLLAYGTGSPAIVPLISQSARLY
jgi:hypothetical protein